MIRRRPLSRQPFLVLALSAALALSACGGGGGGGKTAQTTPSITGTVTAPGGRTGMTALLRAAGETLGLLTPRSAAVLEAAAALPVALVTVDDSGTFVSTVATTATDANGAYAFAIPPGFAPGLRYMVVAGSGQGALRAFATGTMVDVNPYTEVATVLVVEQVQATPGATLGQIAPEQVVGLVETVRDLGTSVDPTTSASQLVAELVTALQTSGDAGSVVANLTEPGGLAGTVTGPGGAPLPGVLVRVIDFLAQTVEATVRTDAAGAYAAHVPPGRYTLSVVNDGTASSAASLWWTAGGGTSTMALADPVAVASTAVRRDVALPAGGRVTGTVTAEASGTPLAGVKVTVRRFEAGAAVVHARTDASGRFTLNVLPGDYYVEVLNDTGPSQPYASELFRASTNGANNRLAAQKLTVQAGASLAADASLVAGHLLGGVVVDPVSGTSVAGVTVRVQDTATGTGITVARATDRDGTYRVWLRPGTYTVLARGQMAGANLATDQVVSFTAPVGVITARLVDAGGAPVSGLYAYVSDAATGSTLGWEFSRGDGVLQVYAPTTATAVRLELRSDAGLPYGTTIYNGKLQLQLGDLVTVPAPATPLDLGTLTIPWGTALTGTVRDAAGAPRGNTIVSVRSGGTTSTYRLANVRTRSDGGYTIGLRPGLYDRVLAYDPAYANSISATIAAGPGWAWHDAVVIGSVAAPLDLAFRAFHAIDGAVSGAVSAGVTIALTGPVSRSAVTGAGGAYAFGGLPDGTYTVTPSLAGYTFSPPSLTAVVNGANVSGQGFTATAVAPATYMISGTIAGPVVEGITVTLDGWANGVTPVHAVTSTNANGQYDFAGLADGNYNVTPSLPGYGFTPGIRPVTVAGNDVGGQDFTITSAGAGHSVSGTVTGLAPDAIATVTLGGDATAIATTSAAGAYAFAGLPDGHYTVTPSLSGYTFSPPSASVTVSGADAVQSFSAAAAPSGHAIGGTVSGAVASGVLVTLSGAASAVAYTNGQGAYAFPGLADGTYTVTPSLQGYGFSPPNAQVILGGADSGGNDFVASAVALPPAPPAAVTAVPGGGGTTLAWTPSAGATSYRVYTGTSLPLAQVGPAASPAGYTAFLGAAPLGQRLYYAVSAVGPAGESALSPSGCTVPSNADVFTSGNALELYDPLCEDQLHGSHWVNPGGYSVKVVGGEAELSTGGDDLEARSIRNAVMVGGASVPGSAGTITSIASDIRVPAASASASNHVVLRAVVRFQFQPPSVQRSWPEQNQDNMTFEVGLAAAGGGLYAYRSLHHCDDGSCAASTQTGISYADPDGLVTVPDTGNRGAAAEYGTTYRATASWDRVTGLLSWTITGGTFGTTGISGTVDPAGYVMATPSYVTTSAVGANLAAAFDVAQLQTRVHDASLTGGGAGKITAYFDNVFAGTTTAVPWDDFGGTGGNSGPTELSLARWNVGAASTQEAGGAAVLSSSARGIASGRSRISQGLQVSHPEQYDMLQADLQIPSFVATAGSAAQVYVDARLHNDGTAALQGNPPGDATGDIVAGLTLHTTNGALGWIRRSMDPSGATTDLIPQFRLLGVAIGTGVHAVRVGYSRELNAFEFGVDGITTSIPAPGGAGYAAPARAPRFLVNTRIDLPAIAGAPAAIQAKVNNVFGRTDAIKGVGQYCSALDPATASSVAAQNVATAPPAPTGGAIVDGTYHLVGLNLYTGAGGASGPAGFAANQVWTFAGSAFSYADAFDFGLGVEREKHVGQFGANGTDLVVIESCPGLAPSAFTYSASGTQLRLYQGTSMEMVLVRQ